MNLQMRHLLAVAGIGLASICFAQVTTPSLSYMKGSSDLIASGVVTTIVGTADVDPDFGAQVFRANVLIDGVMKATGKIPNNGNSICVLFVPGLSESPIIKVGAKYVFFLVAHNDCYDPNLLHRGVLPVVNGKVRTIELRGEPEWQPYKVFMKSP